MTLPQHQKTNYFFYLKALAALAVTATIATGVYLASTSQTTTLAAATFATTTAVVSSPSLIPALVLIGVVAALLLLAYCLSQTASSRNRFSTVNDGRSVWFFGWPNRNYSLWPNTTFFSQPSYPRYGNSHGHPHGAFPTTTHTHPATTRGHFGGGSCQTNTHGHQGNLSS